MRTIVISTLILIAAAAADAQTVVKKTEGGQTVITTTTTGPATGQKTEGGRTMIRIEGGAFIPELGCALGDEGKQVKVIHAMPGTNRPKAYAGIDVQANDLILMVNAKPLKTAAAFRTLYESLAPGDTITLGIKRGEAMHLASFVKVDPKDMPKDRRIIIKKND
jgi:S1-C subfamily serine protease